MKSSPGNLVGSGIHQAPTVYAGGADPVASGYKSLMGCAARGPVHILGLGSGHRLRRRYGLGDSNAYETRSRSVGDVVIDRLTDHLSGPPVRITAILSQIPGRNPRREV